MTAVAAEIEAVFSVSEGPAGEESLASGGGKASNDASGLVC